MKDFAVDQGGLWSCSAQKGHIEPALGLLGPATGYTMKSGQVQTKRHNHFWNILREYLTHWAIAGSIIALTGFAPDHWFAHVFHYVEFPESISRLWPPGFDFRVLIVLAGVSIIGYDVLWRHRAHRKAEQLKSDPEQLSDGPTNRLLRKAEVDRSSIAVHPFSADKRSRNSNVPQAIAEFSSYTGASKNFVATLGAPLRVRPDGQPISSKDPVFTDRELAFIDELRQIT